MRCVLVMCIFLVADGNELVGDLYIDTFTPVGIFLIVQKKVKDKIDVFLR